MEDCGAKFPIHDYARGQIIFSEGDEGGQAFLVKSGVVCVFRTVEGEKVILAHLKAGQIFGEMAIITGEPRSASAEAASACQLVSMTSSQMQEALDKSLPFIRALLDQMLSRFRDMEQKHLARTQNMGRSLKEIRSLAQEVKRSNPALSPDAKELIENIDEIVRKAVKKEKYISLVPRGYMQL